MPPRRAARKSGKARQRANGRAPPIWLCVAKTGAMKTPETDLFGGQKLGHIVHGGAVTGATFAAAQGGATQHERRAMKTGTMFACQAAVAGNGKGAALAATKRRHFRRQAGARIMLVIAQNKADMARLCGQCGAPIGLALRVAEHINHRRVHRGGPHLDVLLVATINFSAVRASGRALELRSPNAARNRCAAAAGEIGQHGEEPAKTVSRQCGVAIAHSKNQTAQGIAALSNHRLMEKPRVQGQKPNGTSKRVATPVRLVSRTDQ